MLGLLCVCVCVCVCEMMIVIMFLSPYLLQIHTEILMKYMKDLPQNMRGRHKYRWNKITEGLLKNGKILVYVWKFFTI